jgi:hypothetical protein
VIFGIDPEHGDSRHAMLGAHLFGKTNRRDRLQQREQRPAEETSLLSGDDGDRLRIDELTCRIDGRVRRAASTLLTVKQVDDRLSFARELLRSGNRLTPCGGIGRIASKEVGDARVVEDVVSR